VGGLEEKLWGLQNQFSPLAPTFVIISDFEEEEHVERKVIEKNKNKQPTKVEQLEFFSLVPIERGLFDVEVNSLYIFVAAPTKA
jgi:hypothetical protein